MPIAIQLSLATVLYLLDVQYSTVLYVRDDNYPSTTHHSCKTSIDYFSIHFRGWDFSVDRVDRRDLENETDLFSFKRALLAAVVALHCKHP